MSVLCVCVCCSSDYCCELEEDEFSYIKATVIYPSTTTHPKPTTNQHLYQYTTRNNLALTD